MQFQPDVVSVFRAIFFIFMMLIVLIVVAIQTLAFCKIFSKTGFSWALGFLMLVPIANIVMLFVLAFAEWPIERELRSYKQQNQMA
jgi:membrane protein YdbS with pleckstrin-like domain